MNLSMPRVRAIVHYLIWTGLFCALLALAYVGRGGAISPPGFQAAIKYIFEFFTSFLGIVGAFYLAEKKNENPGAPPVGDQEWVVFAIIVVGSWVAVPTVSLILSETYESALRGVDTLKLLGQPLATAAVAFTFAKSSPS
jgi:hypothetical protein